jgi:hypothetical protein
LKQFSWTYELSSDSVRGGCRSTRSGWFIDVDASSESGAEAMVVGGDESVVGGTVFAGEDGGV